MKCLELFTGAGGLAMGVSSAGFKHVGLVEFNHDACETMRGNAKGILRGWPVVESDTRAIDDFGATFGEIELLAGGPPCQPFSVGGKARGPVDSRDMFPEAVRALRQTRPLAFVFENVKGILREGFAQYFEYIFLQLSYPSISREPGEAWEQHRSRLERIHTQGISPEYRVVWQLLQAANYGVPQRRERVFLVGFRADLHVAWSFPKPTHSKAVLDHTKFVTGEYYELHGIPSPSTKAASFDFPQLSTKDIALEPWQTVRDALRGLSDPEVASCPEQNHVFIPGARSYPGHTGSPIDEPAKTLKAGDHGVPGGENMIALSDGRVRYFTLREAARLQTFPDSYRFNRSWTETMRALGNAVPVRLAEIVAGSVRRAILPFTREK